MNYQPIAGNQPNHNADPQNTNADDAFNVKDNDTEVYVSPSSSDKPKKHDEKAKREAKGKSPVDLLTGVRDLSDEFEEFSVNNTNKVNAASAPVTVVGPNSTNNTNSFNAAGSSDNAVSFNFKIGGISSFVDPSQYPDDRDMSALEDIIYSDDEEGVGAEADFSNLETSITISPIPTTRVHKDHLVTQIIGDLSSAPQTRNLPKGKRAIGSKWVFKNKKDERGIVIRNKVRLVAQGHTQEEGIDYEEVFAPVVRIEAIRLFLAYASFMGFMIYQMDAKSAFLYGTIEEEELCKAFEKLMKDKFQTSSMGEFTFFFGITNGKSASTPIDTEKPLVKDRDGEDVDVTPKVSHLHAVKRIFRYLKGKPHLGLWYPKDSLFNLVAYSDIDYVGASLDRKSTTGGYQFLGCRLITWQCKKQTVVATSSTEAEYVATVVLKYYGFKISCWTMEEVLQGVAAGIDLFDSTYIYQLTLGGFALNFPLDGKFNYVSDPKLSAMGGDRTKINLKATVYRKDASRIVDGCNCYTCQNHTKAYINHLLNVHEMLAPILLEIHNTHHYLSFFRLIREAIKEGKFEEFRQKFIESRRDHRFAASLSDLELEASEQAFVSIALLVLGLQCCVLRLIYKYATAIDVTTTDDALSRAVLASLHVKQPLIIVGDPHYSASDAQPIHLRDLNGQQPTTSNRVLFDYAYIGKCSRVSTLWGDVLGMKKSCRLIMSTGT
uniref:Queuine tRNA-ribosyltransferase accessory subunit 2-like isoform X1 n=1 Tax=Tanacetum cinerariifolium TaxID=118510 RepID=A0A6L2KIN9_TANCI|nr:queuine tRNA-ribosyltransferase accessory subunit 2-like isoform X1 [Tanacetum cinerariifolium]